MKKITCLFIILFLFCSVSNLKAQVAINTDGSSPDGSSMLDVKSTTLGVLIPRMTQAQRDAISTPVTGLIIFQTDNTPGFYYFNGSSWVVLNAQTMSIKDLFDGKTTNSSIYLGESAGAGDIGLSSCYYNVGVGKYAMNATTSGHHNSVTGFEALYENIDGGYNSGIGTGILYHNSSGSYNSAVGVGTCYNNDLGANNTVMGFNANYSNVDGSNNTIVGYRAGRGTGTHNKSGNVFLGYEAGYYEISDNKLYIENSNTSNPLIYGEFDTDLIRINGDLQVTGTWDLGIDDLNDGKTNTTSVFLGTGAGSNNLSTGNYNTATGYHASNSNTTGDYNTVYGGNANYFNEAGSYNTIIGYMAGRGTIEHDKTGNVFLGYMAGYSETGDNKLYIENGPSSTPLIYGDFTSNYIEVRGNFGVGTRNFGGGSRTLSLVNGSVPTASIANGVLLYAEDVSGSSELKVRDEAGNVTTLSPHNFSMLKKSEPMAWSFYSENHTTGEKINVDMLRVVRVLERIAGEKLAYLENIDGEPDNINMEVNAIGIIQQQQKEIDELKKLNLAMLKRIEKLEED